MSRIFDWLFQPPNQPAAGPDTMDHDNHMHHRSVFGEIDRLMQQTMQEHFQSMNRYSTSHEHAFQLEDKVDEDTNIRDRMLRKPERERNEFHQRESNSFAPRDDVNLDSAAQNNPKFIDQFLDDRPSNQIQQHGSNPFSQIFGSPQNSPNNFSFSSQTVVVKRGPDGKLKYEKRETRQDSQGNREETVTTSDDRESLGQQLLQEPTNEQHTPSAPLRYPPMGEGGMLGRIRNWFFPPND